MIATYLRFGGKRSPRMIERNLMNTRHNWVIIVSGFFEPLLYLLSIGVGIGKLVDHVGGSTITYTQFVAPGLMASSAMNGAVFETTMNMFHKLKYAKTYDAVLATPMQVGDVALGEMGFALLRGSLYATAFLIVMAVGGLTLSWWALFAVPAAVLIGFAFAGVGLAVTSHLRSWQDFEPVVMSTLLLFLFSGIFYPLATYPRPLQLVVEATPLYQGVDLIRSLTLGTVGVAALGHVVYLAVLGLTGLLIAVRRIERMLLS